MQQEGFSLNHKRLLSSLLAAAFLLTAAPALASEASPAVIDESRINPAYTEWIENGRQGPAPSAQDFSYLSESYAALADQAQTRTSRGSLPSSYDLREYGLVDSVVNQGDLGVCWAIAANSSAAGSIRDQFPQLTLSPMHTAWFCYHGNEEEEYAPLSDPYLTGGNDARAVGTLAAWKGPVTNDKAPLLTNERPHLDESLRYAADFHLQDAYYMPTGSYSGPGTDNHVPDSITKQLIMTVGPVSTNYYSHGLSTYNPSTHAVYNNVVRASDHAVLIVGWDDNYPKENFVAGNQPEHDGAWLVRNSWGNSWGDDGYFWLSYEDQTIACGNAYLLEEANNYAHNYQYDTVGWSYSIATDPNNPTSGTAANIFTAESDEQLEAVSFYTTDAGARYHISVYTGVEDGEPTSGTCALAEQSGRETYAGYHTIELDEPVALKAGEQFSIVVTFENPGYTLPVPIEWCPMPSDNYVPVYMGDGGESYIYTQNGWQDVAGPTDNHYYITNVCIKGFTNPLPDSGAAVPQVRFSKMEGPVADGTSLSLSTTGEADIYWSDGGSFQRYTGPISLDALDAAGDSVTIRAYAEADGKRGNTTSRTFSRATALLSDLAVRYGDTTQHLDVSENAQSVTLPLEAESVQLMAQSGDRISLDGETLSSGDWSSAVSLAPGETKNFQLRVSADGKSDSTITLQITRGTGSTPGPSDSPLYPVQISEKPEHGSILISPTAAAKDTIVTLTVSPDAGYTLDALSVTADAGRRIEIRAEGNGRYTFNMPDGAVSLDVRFAKIGEDAVPFDDVFSSDWFFEPVRYVYENGLMIGVSDTLFGPQTSVTRAMIWATLARQANAQDLPAGDEWYSGVQSWAIENNISDGLRPNDSVSREELITMLHRYSNAPIASADLDRYTDAATISPWAEDAMRWGVEQGLITGLTDTTLAPREGATRAQLAAILQRFINLS